MANSVTAQVLENGANFYTVSLRGILDTSDVGVTDLIDTTAAGFQPTNPQQGNPLAFTVKILKVEYDIEDTLAVNLWWDATTDVLISSLVGRGRLKFKPPMENSAGAGKTGKVQYSTQGWAASAVLSFNVNLYCKKAYS